MILGIDLGSHTGLTYDQAGTVVCETKLLATPKELKEQKARRGDRRGDIRVLRLFDLLTDLHEKNQFKAVVVEDVLFSSTVYATQLWASFRAIVWLVFAAKKDVVLEFVSVPTLKKFASGSGAADKSMMEAALKLKHPEIYRPGLGDDSYDAAWLYLWGKQNLSRTKL